MLVLTAGDALPKREETWIGKVRKIMRSVRAIHSHQLVANHVRTFTVESTQQTPRPVWHKGNMVEFHKKHIVCIPVTDPTGRRLENASVTLAFDGMFHGAQAGIDDMKNMRMRNGCRCLGCSSMGQKKAIGRDASRLPTPDKVIAFPGGVVRKDHNGDLIAKRPSFSLEAREIRDLMGGEAHAVPSVADPGLGKKDGPYVGLMESGKPDAPTPRNADRFPKRLPRAFVKDRTPEDSNEPCEETLHDGEHFRKTAATTRPTNHATSGCLRNGIFRMCLAQHTPARAT